jgi:hypothetical protein
LLPPKRLYLSRKCRWQFDINRQLLAQVFTHFLLLACCTSAVPAALLQSAVS